jgi:hypothetical protein
MASHEHEELMKRAEYALATLQPELAVKYVKLTRQDVGE